MLIDADGHLMEGIGFKTLSTTAWKHFQPTPKDSHQTKTKCPTSVLSCEINFRNFFHYCCWYDCACWESGSWENGHDYLIGNSKTHVISSRNYMQYTQIAVTYTVQLITVKNQRSIFFFNFYHSWLHSYPLTTAGHTWVFWIKYCIKQFFLT